MLRWVLDENFCNLSSLRSDIECYNKDQIGFKKIKDIDFMTMNNLNIFCCPYISNVIRVLSENSFDIFLHICCTFKDYFIKKTVLKSFLSFSYSLILIVYQINFSGPNFTSSNYNYPLFLFSFNFFGAEKLRVVTQKTNKNLLEIIIVTFSEAIVFTFAKITGNLFPFERNLLIFSIKIFIKLTQNIKKNLSFGVQEIFFTLLFKNFSFNPNKNFKSWVPGLYEGYIQYKGVFLAKSCLNVYFLKKNIKRKILGASLIYSRLKIFFSGLEFIKKPFQEHFFPGLCFSSNVTEKFFCKCETTKSEIAIKNSRNILNFIKKLEKIRNRSYKFCLNFIKTNFLSNIQIFDFGITKRFMLVGEVEKKEYFQILTKFISFSASSYFQVLSIESVFSRNSSSDYFRNFIKESYYYFFISSKINIIGNIIYFLIKKRKEIYFNFSGESCGAIFELFLEKMVNKNQKKILNSSNKKISFFFLLQTIKKIKISLAHLYCKFGQNMQAYKVLHQESLKHFFTSNITKEKEALLRKQIDKSDKKNYRSALLTLGKITNTGKFFEIAYMNCYNTTENSKFLLAIWFYKKNKIFHSKKQISNCIRLNSRNINNYILFGYLEMKKKNFAIASRTFLKLLTENSDKSNLWKNLLIILLKTNNNENQQNQIIQQILIIKNIPFFIFRQIITILLKLDVLMFEKFFDMIIYSIKSHNYLNLEKDIVFLIVIDISYYVKKKKFHSGKNKIILKKKIRNKAKYFLNRIGLRKKIEDQTIDNWFMLNYSFFSFENLMKFFYLFKIDFLGILKINIGINKNNTLSLQI